MSRITVLLLALLASGATIRAEQMPYPGWGVLLPSEQLRPAQVVYTPGNGVTAPIPLMPLTAPTYSPEAFRRKIQGKVTVDVVVLEDGTVDPDSVKVTQSVDPVYGLDDAAVKAVKQWRFKPGVKDDERVAVRISIECAFSRH